MENFEWDRASRARDILFGVAVGKGLITYGRLAEPLGCRADRMGWILGAVQDRATARGEPLWAALCVDSVTVLPSSGFYDKARSVNPAHAGRSDREIWRVERDRCYAFAETEYLGRSA